MHVRKLLAGQGSDLPHSSLSLAACRLDDCPAVIQYQSEEYQHILRIAQDICRQWRVIHLPSDSHHGHSAQYSPNNHDSVGNAVGDYSSRKGISYFFTFFNDFSSIAGHVDTLHHLGGTDTIPIVLSCGCSHLTHHSHHHCSVCP